MRYIINNFIGDRWQMIISKIAVKKEIKARSKCSKDELDKLLFDYSIKRKR